jgi:uncharacterized membrane protein
MFGIRRPDGFGLIHSGFGLVALLAGLGVMTLRKGTRPHRRLGYVYAGSMLLLNSTALAIYDLFGRFGPFHFAALVSLATLSAGFVPVFLRRPRGAWIELHATFMSWSYVGLVAAFLAEVGVRVPGVGFGPAVVGGLVASMVIGAILIHTRVPRIVGRVSKSLPVGFR